MTIFEKRLTTQHADRVGDGRLSATRIVVALVVALVLYVLGYALLSQNIGALQTRPADETSLYGP